VAWPRQAAVLGVLVAGMGLATACTSTTGGGVGASVTAKAELGSLVVDDHSQPVGVYRREDWPHWEDVDGDGCDAREQALIAQSTSAAQVDPFGCKVVAGDWISIYDGVESSDPSALDVDHVVSLENAFDSGAWGWSVDERRTFANDPDNLLVVSASSNRAKGSSPANRWRPSQRSAWCPLATRVMEVKIKYRLSVTTAERDALGAMADTC
jgi:hypothetical protein